MKVKKITFIILFCFIQGFSQTYVSTTGNDTTGTGTAKSSSEKRTSQHQAGYLIIVTPPFPCFLRHPRIIVKLTDDVQKTSDEAHFK